MMSRKETAGDASQKLFDPTTHPLEAMQESCPQASDDHIRAFAATMNQSPANIDSLVVTAAERSNWAVFHALVEKGAKPNRCSTVYKTPWQHDLHGMLITHADESIASKIMFPIGLSGDIVLLYYVLVRQDALEFCDIGLVTLFTVFCEKVAKAHGTDCNWHDFFVAFGSVDCSQKTITYIFGNVLHIGLASGRNTDFEVLARTYMHGYGIKDGMLWDMYTHMPSTMEPIIPESDDERKLEKLFGMPKAHVPIPPEIVAQGADEQDKYLRGMLICAIENEFSQIGAYPNGAIYELLKMGASLKGASVNTASIDTSRNHQFNVDPGHYTGNHLLSSAACSHSIAYFRYLFNHKEQLEYSEAIFPWLFDGTLCSRSIEMTKWLLTKIPLAKDVCTGLLKGLHGYLSHYSFNYAVFACIFKTIQPAIDLEQMALSIQNFFSGDKCTKKSDVILVNLDIPSNVKMRAAMSKFQPYKYCNINWVERIWLAASGQDDRHCPKTVRHDVKIVEAGDCSQAMRRAAALSINDYDGLLSLFAMLCAATRTGMTELVRYLSIALISNFECNMPIKEAAVTLNTTDACLAQFDEGILVTVLAMAVASNDPQMARLVLDHCKADVLTLTSIMTLCHYAFFKGKVSAFAAILTHDKVRTHTPFSNYRFIASVIHYHRHVYSQAGRQALEELLMALAEYHQDHRGHALTPIFKPLFDYRLKPDAQSFHADILRIAKAVQADVPHMYRLSLEKLCRHKSGAEIRRHLNIQVLEKDELEKMLLEFAKHVAAKGVKRDVMAAIMDRLEPIPLDTKLAWRVDRSLLKVVFQRDPSHELVEYYERLCSTTRVHDTHQVVKALSVRWLSGADRQIFTQCLAKCRRNRLEEELRASIHVLCELSTPPDAPEMSRLSDDVCGICRDLLVRPGAEDNAEQPQIVPGHAPSTTASSMMPRQAINVDALPEGVDIDDFVTHSKEQYRRRATDKAARRRAISEHSGCLGIDDLEASMRYATQNDGIVSDMIAPMYPAQIAAANCRRKHLLHADCLYWWLLRCKRCPLCNDNLVSR